MSVSSSAFSLFSLEVLLVAVLSYLLGSLVFGVIYSRWLGDDIRSRDLPGGSGTFRQYGRNAAIVVSLLDILKGVMAAFLARLIAPDYTWVAMLGVVLGHCYPLYFRFNGGGGIAPLVGALLVIAPIPLLGFLVVGLSLIPLYKLTLQRHVKLNAVPFATALTLPFALWLGMRYGGFYDLLAGSAAMAVRAVHLLALPPAAAAKET